jgi:hypothetical protein
LTWPFPKLYRHLRRRFSRSRHERFRGTPHKKKRRSKNELEELDAALYKLIRDHAPCTVRQVYYRAVVAFLCDKNEAGYNLVQRRVLYLRKSGQVPYSWIEDNTRSYYGGGRYANLEEFGHHASRSLFSLDYWRHKPVNVEVWCESDSIAGALRHTVTNEWGLRLYVARGFSSETFIHNTALELKQVGKPAFIYILSDFDPSGVSLADTIGKKLCEFTDPLAIQVQRIALNAEQVRSWQLPTHPLKKSNTRAAKFRREHADVACELEAVPPNQLRGLVSAAIGGHIDSWRLDAVRENEQLQREALAQLPEFFRTWQAQA